jgi:hypothetical protein
MPIVVAETEAVELELVDGSSPISGMRLGEDGSMMRMVDGGLDDDGARKATGETV